MFVVALKAVALLVFFRATCTSALSDATLESAHISGSTTVPDGAVENYKVELIWKSLVDDYPGGEYYIYFVEEDGVRVLVRGATLPPMPDVDQHDLFTVDDSFALECLDMKLTAVNGISNGNSEALVDILVVTQLGQIRSNSIHVRCVKQGEETADPHFKTWDQEKFDYHGECDLVLLQNHAYDNGQGMDIHIRTKTERFYSYVDAAVLRIGPDTLEVKGGEDSHQYWINGVQNAALPASLAGHKVRFRQQGKYQRYYSVSLGKNGERILIKTYKRFVNIRIEAATLENFAGSLGLLGSFETGHMVGRDGVTILEDANDFGREWQVRASEPMLFHTAEGPQYPELCKMPNVKATQRRLGRSSITEEQAQNACAVVNSRDYDACVYDVLATGDIDVTAAYI